MRFRNVTLILALVLLGLVGLYRIDGAWAGDHIAESEVASILREIDSSFTIKNQPIHPRIFQDLEPWLSDNEPYIVTIDLRTARHRGGIRSHPALGRFLGFFPPPAASGAILSRRAHLVPFGRMDRRD